MSFTSIVKNEVSKLETLEAENISELSALFYNIAKFDSNLKVVTENSSVARRLFQLVKELYDIIPKITVRKGYNYSKHYLYMLEFSSKIDMMKQDLSLDSIVPKNYIIADTDLVRAYLRGLFLAVGSINDPKKSRYHLEFLVDNEKYANFLQTLLNQFDLNSKVLQRENKYMVYMKEAEKIGDFLRIICASNAVMYYEDIRIYRDHKNMTNRLNNCEQANVDKMIATALEQVNDIELIQSMGAFDLLEDKVKEAATYRLKYKEVSLQELSEIISLETNHEITKSGLYHRFQKIKKMAQELKKKK